MNFSDSERIATVLEGLGFTSAQDEKEANLILFNTCSIRQNAENRVFGLVRLMRTLKKEHPDLIVGITGCMVRRSSTRETAKNLQDELVKKMPTTDFVFRIEDLPKLKSFLQEIKPDLKFAPEQDEALSGTVGNYFKITPKTQNKFQAFVPIMTGCDKFCTYCVVPFTRGREKSRPLEEIVAEVTLLAEQGCKEITLIGQNVNSYGLSFADKIKFEQPKIPRPWESDAAPLPKGQKPPFVKLLEALNKIDGIDRIRFVSPHPQDMSDSVITALATLPKLCNYVHLPVQAGDNDVLKRMRRTYTREQYFVLVEKLHKAIPDLALSTDMIVGFPGETKAQFENSYKLYKEVEWDMCFLAQYSARRGTFSAAHYPDDVSPKEKARRWHKVNTLLTKIAAKKHKACIGTTQEVLVEKQDGTHCSGRARNFKLVQFESGREMIGKIARIKIVGAGKWHLKGELI